MAWLDKYAAGRSNHLNIQKHFDKMNLKLTSFTQLGSYLSILFIMMEIHFFGQASYQLS